MKGINRIYRDEQGSILMVVAGFCFIAIFLVLGILDLASNSRRMSQEQVDMEKAMFVAEGGLERGARFMESNLAAIVTSATGCTNGSGNIGSGSYTFSIIRSNASASTYYIIATGTVSTAKSGVGIKRVCSLLNVYQPTYAEFALWSSTNGAIWFVNGEVFNGHVHADDKLYFDAAGGGPVFHSSVTSDAGTYTVNNGTLGNITLDQGLTLNSFQGTMADVDFNSAASSSLKNKASGAAANSGTLLQGSTTITFNGATLSISNDRKFWTNHVYTPAAGADVIFYIQTAASGTTATRPGTVYLNGGTLSGRMSIATESDVTVAGNIHYKTDPSTTPSSTDALGLISMGDVWVGTSAPNNLTIDAAIMATGIGAADAGSFGVVNYNSGASRGTLTVYGGIVQEIRGAVGTGSGTTGYIKNYSYDPRFITRPPPYYPTISNQVSFSQWTEGH